jgi:hypothetical protein
VSRMMVCCFMVLVGSAAACKVVWS